MVSKIANLQYMSKLLYNCSLALEILGKPFNAQAYRNASDIVRNATSMAELEHRLTRNMYEHAQEIWRTGRLRKYERLLQLPIFKLMRSLVEIDGIGPTLARRLINLGLRDVSELTSNETYFNVLPHVTRMMLQYKPERQIPRRTVELIGNVISRVGVQGILVGSYRRGQETCQDVDYLVVDQALSDVKNRLIAPHVFTRTYLLMEGENKLAMIVRYRGKNYRLDITYTNHTLLPYALLHHTGNWKFNIALRRHAIRKGLKLSQLGLFDSEGNSVIKRARTEEDIFAALELDFVPPEDRRF